MELAGRKFDEYLAEEGLERVRELRKGEGPVREIYSRCAKSLLRVGEGSAGYDKALKAVHMVPAPTGSGAEWESLWASLTFELPVH